MTQTDLRQMKTIITKALKENNKNLVTKNDLKQAFIENNKNLVTKDDLKQAFIENNKNLVTKDDLKQAFIENNKNLVTKDDLKQAFIENNKNLVTKNHLDKKLSGFKKELKIEIKDEIIGEFCEFMDTNVMPILNNLPTRTEMHQIVDVKIENLRYELKGSI